MITAVLLTLGLRLTAMKASDMYKSVCENLIVDDPHEFEGFTKEDIERLIERLEIKQNFRPLSQKEQSELDRLIKTLRIY